MYKIKILIGLSKWFWCGLSQKRDLVIILEKSKRKEKDLVYLGIQFSGNLSPKKILSLYEGVGLILGIPKYTCV